VAHFQRASDDRHAARRTQRANAASWQVQPVLAVSGIGFDFCGSSRSRMAFNAWMWGDSDRGSKSTSRRSAVIRTARSLSVRSSCIMSNMARKRSDGKARPARPCETRRCWRRSRISLKASTSPSTAPCGSIASTSLSGHPITDRLETVGPRRSGSNNNPEGGVSGL
jgi:hypothetical protein